MLTVSIACMDKQLQDGSVIALRQVAKSSRQLAGSVAHQRLGCRQLKDLASWCYVPRALCRNVVHRDLKLENLLLASPDEITKVRRVLLWHGTWRARHSAPHPSAAATQQHAGHRVFMTHQQSPTFFLAVCSFALRSRSLTLAWPSRALTP